MEAGVESCKMTNSIVLETGTLTLVLIKNTK